MKVQRSPYLQDVDTMNELAFHELGLGLEYITYSANEYYSDVQHMSIDCQHQIHLVLLKCRILSFTLLLLNLDISGGSPRDHISNKFPI